MTTKSQDIPSLDQKALEAANEVLRTIPMTATIEEEAVAIVTAYLSAAAPKSEGAVTGEPARGIYVASKVKHVQIWKAYRKAGYPIVSTWIDEAGAGESQNLSDLWKRCIREASMAGAFVLYRALGRPEFGSTFPPDELKGAWIELGAALASDVPVFAVGIEEFTVAKDNRIVHCTDVNEAMKMAKASIELAALAAENLLLRARERYAQAPAAPSQEAVLRVARLILSVSSVSYDEANNERRAMARAAAEKVIAVLASPQGQESGVTKP